MATTTILPIHRSEGKSIAQSLELRIDYIKNPEKTNDGEHVCSYGCNVLLSDKEFLLSKMQYERQTGRKQKRDVLAYHMRQSFPAGEVTAEQANKIAYETAMRITKGKHAFIVATHTDTAHIHSHIIFNSTSLDCKKKFHNFWGSTLALRKISDRLCLENGLSIVLHPSKKSKDYGTWLGEDKPVNLREQLKDTILKVLAKQPTSYEDFLQEMEQAGYEIKRGKHTGFRASADQRFLRLRSLGEDFSEENLRKIIDKEAPIPEVKARKKRVMQAPKMGLLIDVQKKLDEGKGAGYAHWANIYNAKQMANALNFISENHFDSFADLEEKAKEISAEFHKADAELCAINAQIAQKETMRTQARNYHRCRPIYEGHRDSGWSKQYKLDHVSDLVAYNKCREYFNAQGIQKLPSIARLNDEINVLYEKKSKAYSAYKQVHERMKKIQTARQNIEIILEDAHVQQPEKPSPRRTKATRDDR